MRQYKLDISLKDFSFYCLFLLYAWDIVFNGRKVFSILYSLFINFFSATLNDYLDVQFVQYSFYDASLAAVFIGVAGRVNRNFYVICGFLELRFFILNKYQSKWSEKKVFHKKTINLDGNRVSEGKLEMSHYIPIINQQ